MSKYTTYNPFVYDPTGTYTSTVTSALPASSASIEVITEYVNDEIATVDVYVNIPDVFEGVVNGTAKRDPIDKPDDILALNLAYGRAFDKVARKILRRAEGMVRHNDYIRDVKRQNRQEKIAGIPVHHLEVEGAEVTKAKKGKKK